MFSWEVCEIFKNIYVEEHLPTTAFGVFFHISWKFQKNLLECFQWVYTLFLISNTFISSVRLKLVKNQAYAKQHPEAELWLFENYSHSSSTLSSKNNRTYCKKYVKELYLWDYTINHNENEDGKEK